ncbi:hypothetical protein ACQR3P_29075 [Rhodococcus sp. IEGM1300]
MRIHDKNDDPIVSSRKNVHVPDRSILFDILISGKVQDIDASEKTELRMRHNREGLLSLSPVKTQMYDIGAIIEGFAPITTTLQQMPREKREAVLDELVLSIERTFKKIVSNEDTEQFEYLKGDPVHSAKDINKPPRVEIDLDLFD